VEKITLNTVPGGNLKKYYEEYPKGEFLCSSDERALEVSKAKILYRKSDTEDENSIIILRKEVIRTNRIL
jgi:hypothetical protein